ncbi:hypothetical protein BH24ACI4_BH24ACI4_28550 [soil metagenome]
MVSRMTRGWRATACAAAMCVTVVATTAAQDRFTPHDVARIRTVTAAAISPDGAHVAYVLMVPRVPFAEEDGAAWEELHVVGRDGTSRGFVTGAVNVRGIKWLPDGKSIAFLARRGSDQTRGIYAIPVSGGEARRLLRHDTDVVQFDVSADGRRVAYVARPEKPRERQELERRGFTQEVFEEAVQPQRLWTADLRNGAAEGGPVAIALPGHPSHVSWSPDGTRLLVIQAPTPFVERRPGATACPGGGGRQREDHRHGREPRKAGAGRLVA